MCGGDGGNFVIFFGNDRGSLVCEQAEPGEPRFFGSVGSEGL
jgi:hypothetical protein